MKNPVFTGVCTALVTPFLDEKINYPMAEQLIRRQMDSGIHAIVLSGTTGESATLSDGEKIELVRRSKEFTGNRCTIIAGTGSNSTKCAVDLSIKAEQAGADALLVVSPYYNKANNDGLYIHYLSIADAVKIPVILYNVPSRTGLDIPISVYKKLAKIPNIVGVKEASADIRKIIQIRRECPADFYIWTGNDDQSIPAIALGGVGVISVLSNVYPLETAAMVNSALAGDFHTATVLQNRLMPLIDLLFCEVNPIPVKEAMRQIGFDCGDCRLPLSKLSEENKLRLIAYLHKNGAV